MSDQVVLYFLYIPLNRSSGIPNARFGIILPESYPHKFISELIPCSRIFRVSTSSVCTCIHLGAHIICVPTSFVIRDASLSLVCGEVVASVSVSFACQ